MNYSTLVLAPGRGSYQKQELGYISHNLNDVFEVADRISVLYLGRMAAQVRTAVVTDSSGPMPR